MTAMDGRYSMYLQDPFWQVILTFVELLKELFSHTPGSGYVLLQKVKELHLEDMDVVVEPGIGWMELNEYLKPHGLFFPLDPGFCF